MFDDVDKYRAQRREELAKETYNSSYYDLCGARKDIVNDRISIEMEKSAAG